MPESETVETPKLHSDATKRLLALLQTNWEAEVNGLYTYTNSLANVEEFIVAESRLAGDLVNLATTSDFAFSLSGTKLPPATTTAATAARPNPAAAMA